MAQLSGALITYDEVIRREDLSDIISDVSPDSAPLYDMLPKTTAEQTLHEWSEYNISRDSSVSTSVEGDDNSYSDLTVAGRLNNICQIIKKPFAVTETEIAVDKAGAKDAYAREMTNAMRRWKISAEFALIRGSKASGSSGIARQMEGLINFIQGNSGLFTARNSGTSLSENAFIDVLSSSWGVTDDYMIDLVLTTSTLKVDVDNFTAGNTRRIEAEDKKLVKSVSVYEGGPGSTPVRIMAHKDIPDNHLVGVRKELLGVAHLRNRTPKHVANSVTGDSKKGHIVGELTLKVESARPMIVQAGYNLGR